jgi:hypothetical protein
MAEGQVSGLTGIIQSSGSNPLGRDYELTTKGMPLASLLSCCCPFTLRKCKHTSRLPPLVCFYHPLASTPLEIILGSVGRGLESTSK